MYKQKHYALEIEFPSSQSDRKTIIKYDLPFDLNRIKKFRNFLRSLKTFMIFREQVKQKKIDIDRLILNHITKQLNLAIGRIVQPKDLEKKWQNFCYTFKLEENTYKDENYLQKNFQQSEKKIQLIFKGFEGNKFKKSLNQYQQFHPQFEGLQQNSKIQRLIQITLKEFKQNFNIFRELGRKIVKQDFSGILNYLNEIQYVPDVSKDKYYQKDFRTVRIEAKISRQKIKIVQSFFEEILSKYRQKERKAENDSQELLKKQIKSQKKFYNYVIADIGERKLMEVDLHPCNTSSIPYIVDKIVQSVKEKCNKQGFSKDLIDKQENIYFGLVTGKLEDAIMKQNLTKYFKFQFHKEKNDQKKGKFQEPFSKHKTYIKVENDPSFSGTIMSINLSNLNKK